MYKAFFSLKVKPFDLLPNPEFLFLSKSHKKASTYLDYAVENRAGFILLTGEIGSGKTTLIRNLFNKHQQNVVLSRIVNTRVNFEQLLSLINDDFGLPNDSKDKLALLRQLNEFLVVQYRNGSRSILVIDEAQNLTPDVLEELRLLSNLETDNIKLLHIVLAGQPELRQTLALPELLQLRQRISCFCHVQPLEENEIEGYILHRLERAGNRTAVDFSAGAIDLIWHSSRGIPRLINTICDFMLLLAFAEEKRTITLELVQAVLVDLDFENCYWGDATAPPKVSPLPSSPDMVLQGDADESVKAMLTGLVNRVDQLEKLDHSSQPPNSQFKQTLSAPVAINSPPQAAKAPGKKRGWFGLLFRAA